MNETTKYVIFNGFGSLKLLFGFYCDFFRFDDIQLNWRTISLMVGEMIFSSKIFKVLTIFGGVGCCISIIGFAFVFFGVLCALREWHVSTSSQSGIFRLS